MIFLTSAFLSLKRLMKNQTGWQWSNEQEKALQNTLTRKTVILYFNTRSTTSTTSTTGVMVGASRVALAEILTHKKTVDVSPKNYS